MISIVAAMSHNRVIGNNNGLPRYFPEDLKRFRKLTIGKTVVMGRNTFLSIGQPLKHRRNIVLSRMDFEAKGIEVYSSIQDVLDATQNEAETMIIGGEQIYKLFLPFAQRIYLTYIHNTYQGDRYFPEFEDHFVLIQEEKGEQFDFRIFARKQ